MKSFGKFFLGCAVLASLAWAGTASAMPSYSRQTGLDCNSCHIGFAPVPNFTRTGRLFIMRGFHWPNSVAGKFREHGFNAEGKKTPHYGGNYLALNWKDFFSARIVPTLLSGGATPGIGGGTKRPTSSNLNANVFELFYTGPITDWLGIWTEVGYLGVNAFRAANSTSTAGQSPGNATNLNKFAFDEFRLTASRMLGGESFIAMSMGNEYPDAINEFVFPVFQIRPWGYGQGGVGTEYSTVAWSFLGFWNNSILTQYSIITGDSDSSWSNGHNNYVAIGYDGVPGTGDRFRRESNDLWFVLDGVWGNNVGSQVNPTRTSFLCPGTCPGGVTDSSLSFSNHLGYSWDYLGDLAAVNGTGYETVDTSHAWRLSVHSSVADWGNNSWYQSLAIAKAHQDYLSGATSDQEKIGYTIRYFYNRTYGGGLYINKTIHYDYTTPAGVKYAAYAPTHWGVYALWAPAMNMNFELSYGPSITPVLIPADYRSGGYSWSLSLNMGF